MFEPGVVAAAGVERGLLLVDTDHGFNLGHQPGATPATGVLVARRRGDANDRELYERLGRPPTYRYLYDVTGSRPPKVVHYVPPPAPRYEAEAEWPALLERGSAYPTHFPCASAGKGLRLFPGTLAKLSAGPASTTVVGWFSTTPGPVTLELAWAGAEPVRFSAEGPGCSAFTLRGPGSETSSPLEVQLLSGEGAVDYVEAGHPELGGGQP